MSSPSAMVTVGQILSPWGTQGDLRVRPLTDFPERFVPGRRLFVGGVPLVIDGVHAHKGGLLLLKIATVNTQEQAQALQGQLLEIPQDELPPLPEGDYYWFQIMGLEVWTTAGVLVGEIVDILRTPGNDVYVVRRQGQEVLIPAVDDVVQEVDLAKGRVVVEAIEGLLRG